MHLSGHGHRDPRIQFYIQLLLHAERKIRQILLIADHLITFAPPVPSLPRDTFNRSLRQPPLTVIIVVIVVPILFSQRGLVFTHARSEPVQDKLLGGQLERERRNSRVGNFRPFHVLVLVRGHGLFDILLRRDLDLHRFTRPSLLLLLLGLRFVDRARGGGQTLQPLRLQSWIGEETYQRYVLYIELSATHRILVAHFRSQLFYALVLTYTVRRSQSHVVRFTNYLSRPFRIVLVGRQHVVVHDFILGPGCDRVRSRLRMAQLAVDVIIPFGEKSLACKQGRGEWISINLSIRSKCVFSNNRLNNGVSL